MYMKKTGESKAIWNKAW